MTLWQVGDRVTVHEADRELCRQKMRGYWRRGVVIDVEGVREDGELLFRVRGLHEPATRVPCAAKERA